MLNGINNRDMLKEKLTKSIDEYLSNNLGGMSFSDLFLDNMAEYIIWKCSGLLNTPDMWISVIEKLPSRQEWYDSDSKLLRRINIAFQNDKMQYVIGYYNGSQWFDDRFHILSNVIAWKPFITYTGGI